MRLPSRSCARAASLLLGAAGALAQELPGRAPIVPHDWLVIVEIGARSEHLVSGDHVFFRYLLDPESPPPVPEERVAGGAGEERRWAMHAGSGDDEIHAPHGYAYTSVPAEETGVWMARLSGAKTLFVNGDGFTGDELRRGFQGVPVELLDPEGSTPLHGSHNPAREVALARHGLDPELAGPFASCFDQRCFLVVGTAGDDAEDEALLKRARYDLQRLWSRYNVVPALVSDEELFRRNVPEYFRRSFPDVILYGNEDTNSALRWLVRDESPCRVKRGRARVNGELHEGEDLLCVFSFTSSVYGADARFEIGVLADTGAVGNRLGYGISLWESKVEPPVEPFLLDPGFLTAD